MLEFRDKASNYHIYQNMSKGLLSKRIKNLYNIKEEVEELTQGEPVGNDILNKLMEVKLSKLDKAGLVSHVIALQDVFDGFCKQIIEINSSSDSIRIINIINYR